MSEPARELWHLDDLIATIVEKIQKEGRPASVIIDAMQPRLNPRDSWIATRAGLIYLANDKRGGMRSFRSGHLQTARSSPKPVAEESAGLEEFADRVLERLIYHGADGDMRSVLDFDHKDAKAAYQERVEALRERADREEPFWKALIAETKKATLRKRSKAARKKLAKLAITARLTADDE